MRVKQSSAAGLVLLAAWLGGCSTPPATLDLITAARAGLDGARQAELAHQAQLAEQLARQAAALDAAFDADVKLVAAGQIVGPDSQPARLTGEWVISARQGYAAALRALQTNQAQDQKAHAARMDNLAATDEALQMASELVSWQMKVSEPIRQRLLALQKRWIHE